MFIKCLSKIELKKSNKEGVWIYMKKFFNKKNLSFAMGVLILSQLLLMGNFVTSSAVNLSGYDIILRDDHATPLPSSLSDGEVWSGKSVEHNEDGTITVRLFVWGKTYYACDECTEVHKSGGSPVHADNHQLVARPPLSENDPYVYFTDDFLRFRLKAGSADGIGEFDIVNGKRVWKIHQGHIIGDNPIIFEYTLELDPAIPENQINGSWEMDYWYSTGGAQSKFTPCFYDPEYYPFANPFYYTKEETTYNSFTLSMNWNNGNGLNSGTITDKIFNETIIFGSNKSPEFQGAYDPPNAPKSKTVAGANNWALNARRPSINATYYWHLEWEKANTIKSYWFTVRDMDKAWSAKDNDFILVDIVYRVDFPNPGGNNSTPAGRTRVGEDYFQRTFQMDKPSELFVWDGNAINTTMNVVGKILLREKENWELGSGILTVSKQLEGWYDTDWNVDEYTAFEAIVRVAANNTVLFNRYLIFELSENQTNANVTEYVFNGITDNREFASNMSFCPNKPSVVTGIPHELTWRVEELFQTETYGLVHVTYTHGDETSNQPIDISGISGESQDLTITNDYEHGVGYLEVHKLLDGFPAEWGVNKDTIFHIRVKDLDYDNYLLFKNVPGPDGTYRCVGNDVDGLSEAYLGTTITAIPISANRYVKLSNLWTWGKYEVQEVYETSPGVWEEVRELDGFNYSGCLRGCNGVLDDCREKCGNCPSMLCQWKVDDDWTHAVTYSENNGSRDLQFNETIVVTMTNSYKSSIGKMTVFKKLEGSPMEWGVNENTMFHIKVSDEAHGNYLVFDKNVRPNGSYRVVGHVDCGVSDCEYDNITVLHDENIGKYVHYSGMPSDGYGSIIVEVPLSVNSPALLSNLWTGDEHKYKIEEVYSGKGAHYSANYTFNNGEAVSDGIVVPADEGTSLIVNLTNSFKHNKGSLAVFKKLDPAGAHDYWNVDNSTKFSAVIRVGNRFMTFNNSNKYTGTTSNRAQASMFEFSVDEPFVITDIPEGTLITVEEINTGRAYEDYVVPKYSETDCGVAAGECLTVTVTNMFLNEGVDMKVKKSLAGSYADYDVDNKTEFKAKVSDITGNAQLIFTEESKGSYRCIGHLDCGDASCTNIAVNKDGVWVHYSEAEGSDYVSEITFSVNQEAYIKNLWPGRVYAVEEIVDDNFTAMYSFNHVPEDFMLEVTVTNDYIDKSEPAPIYKVIYNENWPKSAPRKGNAPSTKEHHAGVNVVVEENPGNLSVTDWVKLGWALEPTNSLPDFWKGSQASQEFQGSTPLTENNGDVVPNNNTSFTMPARDVDLYGVWQPRPLVKNVNKSVSQKNYMPGDTVSYTVSFVLSEAVNFYEYVMIKDTFPSDALSFMKIESLKIGGEYVAALVTPNPTLVNSQGYVDVTLDERHYENRGGETVELKLIFTVNEGTEGIVHNTAKVFVKTAYDDVPDESDGSDIEIIVEEGKVILSYDPNWPDGKKGSGDVPFDDSVYTNGDTATVKDNDGGLSKQGYDFLGWSSDPNAKVPEFSTDEEIPMDSHRVLYGVWKLNINLSKTASSDEYNRGGTLDYTISFRMPISLEGFKEVKIEDVIPVGLTYANNFELLIGEYDASSEVTVQTGTRGGRSTRFVVLEGGLLSFSEGRDVRLTMRFNVTSLTDGLIENIANVYFTPNGEAEPSTPDGSDSITLPPGEDIDVPTEGTPPTPPDNTTASPPDDTTVSPPDDTTVSPPDDTTASPPDDTAASHPDDTTASPPDVTTTSPPDNTVASPPDVTTTSPPPGVVTSPPDMVVTTPPLITLPPTRTYPMPLGGGEGIEKKPPIPHAPPAYEEIPTPPDIPTSGSTSDNTPKTGIKFVVPIIACLLSGGVVLVAKKRKDK
jgi:fimbrial isopeptide formation D2 family protein